jgi:hypothetical protein
MEDTIIKSQLSQLESKMLVRALREEKGIDTHDLLYFTRMTPLQVVETLKKSFGSQLGVPYILKATRRKIR